MVLILAPLSVQSAPILELTGYGHSSEGLASRYESHSSSAYFNPAQINLEKTRLQISARSWFRHHNIHRKSRPNGYDVPQSVFEARVIDGTELRPLNFRPLPTSQIPIITQQTDYSHSNFAVISLTYPLIKNRLAIGMLTSLPLGSFQSQEPFYVDERAQFFGNQLHFETLSKKFGNFVLCSGINLNVIDNLRVGIGLTLSNQSLAEPRVFVSDAAQTESSLTLSQVEVKGVLTPHFGASYTVTSDWIFSATVHLPYRSGVEGASNLRYWDQSETAEPQKPVKFNFVYDYMPLRISGGQQIRFPLGNHHLLVSGGISWQQWSTYIDRMGHRPNNFSNTLIPEGKVQLSSQSHLSYVSGRYTPSGIPQQDGRTNYVDNDRFDMDLGYQYRVKSESTLYIFGVNVQGYHLFERLHNKRSTSSNPVIDELPDSVSVQDGILIEKSVGLQTNNPGFPGFSSSGFGLQTGLTVGVEYE